MALSPSLKDVPEVRVRRKNPNIQRFSPCLLTGLEAVRFS